jgi:hypothetical protein
MRPGCSRPATARITFDSTESAVWIDPVGEDPVPASELCRVHADALHAPLGWTVNDRRPGAPPPEPERRRPGAAERVEADPEDPAPTTSAPDVERADGPGDETVDEPGDETGSSASDRSDAEPPEPGDDAGAHGSPDRGPEPQRNILDRAFGWTGPQRSVLTQPAVAPPEAGEERHPV